MNGPVARDLRSMQSRLLRLSLPLVMLVLCVAALLFERSYRLTLEQAEYETLQLQLWSLLADAEIEDQQLRMPAVLQEPGFARPASSLLGFVLDASGQRLWQSPSVELLGFDTGLLDTELVAVRAGQAEQRRLAAGYFVLRQGVSYLADSDVAGEQPKRLTFVVVELGEDYALRLANWRQNLFIALSVLLAVLMAAQYFVVTWGLSPLSRLAAEIRAIEQGSATRIEGDYPVELHRLADNINLLLATQVAQQSRYRNTLADVSHSLKTPLAVLASSLESEAVKTLPIETRGNWQQQIDTMSRIISQQLKRASVRSPEPEAGAGDVLGQAAVDGPAALRRLVNAMNMVYRDKPVDCEQLLDDMALRMDEADLLELFGGLLDNAWKYCNGRVRISLAPHTVAGQALVTIEDDGAGIPAAMREQVLQRGVRLDQAVAGQGIGLAVSQDIVDAYAGSLEIDQSPLGGARLQLTLPAQATRIH